MFDLSIKTEDKKWLNAYYPNLRIQNINNNNAEIVGTLDFKMAYQEKEESYVINPSTNYVEGVKIQDSYEIRIKCKSSKFSDLPQIFETGSRIVKVAQNKSLELEDLHVNKNGALCLCIKQEEARNFPSGFNYEDFFKNLVIPFFYAQSYFEQYDSWPWGEHSHGILGFFEWYLEQEKITSQSVIDFLERLKEYNNCFNFCEKLKQLLESKRNVKGHLWCLCGKKEKFRDCHPEVFRGIYKFKEDIKRFDINFSSHIPKKSTAKKAKKKPTI